mgnify:CR=1 FL=1
MRICVLSLLLLATLASGILNAAVPVPEKLSLQDAVRIALGGNPTLKQAEESYLSSESELRIASIKATYSVGSEAMVEDTPERSGVTGRIFGSVDYANLLGTKASLDISPYGMGSDRGSVGLSVRHPLIGGKGPLSEKANVVLGRKTAVAIQDKEFYRSRQAIVVGVIDAYYQAVLARERIKVQERAVQISETAYNEARQRLDEQLVTGLEVTRAETSLAQTKDALNLQQQSARGALDRLMIAMGLGIGETPELTDGIPEVSLELPDLSTAIKTALANRAELAVYDERLLDQERQLAVAKDQLRPRVDAVIGYRSQNKDAGSISTSLFDLGSLNAGLEVSFPLDKTARVEERDTAARSLEVLKEMRSYRADQIVEEVRRAYRNRQAAEASLAIYSQNLDVARDQLSLAQQMVEEGLGSNREVLDAQNALTRVESGVLSAKTDLYLASIDLLYAMGEDLSTVVLK